MFCEYLTFYSLLIIFRTDRCSLECLEKEVDDFLNYFGEKLISLIPHEFVCKGQAQFLKDTKENLKANEFVVISDFSENYSFKIQAEIQSYHWVNEQCTLHPFSIYYKIEDELKTISFVVVAESLEHNIVSVHLFQTKLFVFLRQKFGTIDKIYFFSDGCAAQYKNKKNFLNLCELKEKQGFEAEWHFFATYHGKSPCDALGGAIKRMAMRASLQREFSGHINSARKLFTFIQGSVTAINTELCTKKEHDEMAKLLKHKYDGVKTIPGTQKYHAFIPIEGTLSLNCKRMSTSGSSTKVTLR